ncbi:hypothetical protein ACF5W4_11795 [Bacillota bacterium Lsc_1132]
MKKFECSDKQIEELLRKMPKLQDVRQPQDIYHCLTLKMKKRKRMTWLIPSITTVAAFLLFMILVPSFLNLQGDSNSSENRLNGSSSSNQLASENKQMIKMDAKPFSDHNQVQLASLKTAAYKSDIGNGKVLTYWIPNLQAQLLVPVSTIVLHPGNKTWLELFTEKMPYLREKEWGLSEYYPVHAKFTLDGQSNSVVVDVPTSNPYRQGLTAEKSFIHAMERNISSNSDLKKIKFTTNGQSGMMLDNEGKKTEINVTSEGNRAYFFYFPDGKKIPFLVPSLKTFPDIKSALAAMHDGDPELGLRASVSPALKFKFVGIKNKTLYLTVTRNHPLKNNAASVYSYEAILLTAKEFGLESVKFKNISLKKLGPFDLSKENKVPVAANLKLIEDQP